MTRPVEKRFKISQKFGRTEFAKKPSEWYRVFEGVHPGLNFNAPPETKVQSTLPGYIVRKECHQGMGNVIATRTGNIYALYAHLSKFSVSLGDFVKENSLLGLSEEAGKALTEDHLHFELRDLSKNSKKEDFCTHFPAGHAATV